LKVFQKSAGRALCAVLVFSFLLGGFPPVVRSGDLGLVDGLWVMKKVDEVYEGDDVQEDLHLILDKTGDRAGNPRFMDVRWLKKDFGKEKGLIIHFIGPRYVAGVTLSMTIKPYMDDDRWLYFPEANLIRRVAAADRYTNFMGTDFSYFDLSEREPDEEKHTLLRIEEFGGAPCYVVETVPKNSVDYAAYASKITWVDKDRFLKLRIEYYNREGKLKKRYDPGKWQKIDGIWTPTVLVMDDVLGFHKTIIERSNIRYNQGIGKEYFLAQNVDCVVYRDGKFSLIPFDQRPTLAWQKKRKALK
jgi:hypothetical protein